MRKRARAREVSGPLLSLEKDAFRLRLFPLF